MLALNFAQASGAPLRLLCIGAHVDDIEIGCGGTLLQLLAERKRVSVRWVILAANAVREREARRSARRILRGAAALEIQIGSLRDGYLPYFGAQVKDVIESLKSFKPDLIFTHARSDLHQDHRIVSELTWNTFRNHEILEYEIPKYDGDLGQPNVFVPLTAAVRRRKLRLLMSAFPSQMKRSWFTTETFDALMRLRGIEGAAPSGYAEAFYGRKLALTFSARRR